MKLCYNTHDQVKNHGREVSRRMNATNWSIVVLILLIKGSCAFNLEREYVGFGISPTEASLEFLKPSEPAVDLGYDERSGCYCQQQVGISVLCNGMNSCTKVPKYFNATEKIYSLVNTQIETIQPFDFETTSMVIEFLLEGNLKLTKIMPDSFKYNTKLTNLSISFNSNLRSLHPQSFRGLINMQTLCLVKNGFNNVIDITTALHPSIAPKLVRLSMNQNYFMNISKHEFAPMNGSALQIVNLALCRLDYIDPDCLEPLTDLRILRLGENNFNISTITNIVERAVELRLPLELLDLNGLGFRMSLPKRLLEAIAKSNVTILSLAKNHFEVISSDSFPYMPNLAVLELNSVSTLEIKDDAFKNFPNLKKLRLSKNKLYTIQKGVLLPNLAYLDLEENSGDVFMPSYFEVQNEIFANMSELLYLNLNYNRILNLYPKSFHGLNKLEMLGMKNSSINKLPEFAFSTLNSLKFLNIENNYFIKYEYGKTLPCNLLTGLKSLQVLFFGGSEITNVPSHCNPFADLTSLLHLGLEKNRISYISPSHFEPLKRLTSIDLSFNLIGVWNEPMIPRSVQKIHMSYNKINSLTATMLDDFTHVKDLELYSNPIDCNCMLVSVANEWIKKKEDNNDTFGCLLTKSTCLADNFTISDFYASVERGDIDCDFTILILLPLGALFVCVLALGVFVYYYRWHIKYWIFLTRLYLTRSGRMKPKITNNNNANYSYDAFVSYSNEDSSFVMKLISMLENFEPFLKLCVYERDFQIGSVISESVLDSLTKSRKTLLVISDNYAKSQWCRWESHIAEYHRLFLENGGNENIQDNLVLVKLGPVSRNNLTPTLKFLLKTRIYLQWDNEGGKEKMFWDKLRNTLTPTKFIQQNQHV